ncbi:A-kinase anchor protein 13-like isoform X3 [Polypterus senegalus]|uniref:A-kinase anchor protein 13-like isoform X3 n=1 Tax=Polypterus senegalus TaxID=55291 RepID=UPI001962D57A|nr:A-kinase anchor protein 13-like isoform X3 [Polypterus senegalus]
MKLNPQQSPLYGECVITVQLCEEELSKHDEDDYEFYLLFAGTSQWHVSSMQKVDSTTLQAVSPGHDCCESVKVELWTWRSGCQAETLATNSFSFIQDTAFDVAQFLLSTAGKRSVFDSTKLLEKFTIGTEEWQKLDKQVVLAIQHLIRPEEPIIIGTEVSSNDLKPTETLLHFTARNGLLRLSWFLLQDPFVKAALVHENAEGHTPLSLARERGHSQLLELFAKNSETDLHLLDDLFSSSSPVKLLSSTYRVKQHPQLNTFTLTLDTEKCQPFTNIEKHIQQLRDVIYRNSFKEVCLCPSAELQSIDEAILQSESQDFFNMIPSGLRTNQSLAENYQEKIELECNQADHHFQTDSNSAYNIEINQAENHKALELPVNCCSESRVRPCEHMTKDCTKEKKKEVEVEFTSTVVDSGNLADKKHSELGETDKATLTAVDLTSGKYTEETDTSSLLFSTDQDSFAHADKLNQEVELEQINENLLMTAFDYEITYTAESVKYKNTTDQNMGQMQSGDHLSSGTVEICQSGEFCQKLDLPLEDQFFSENPNQRENSGIESIPKIAMNCDLPGLLHGVSDQNGENLIENSHSAMTEFSDVSEKECKVDTSSECQSSKVMVVDEFKCDGSCRNEDDHFVLKSEEQCDSTELGRTYKHIAEKDTELLTSEIVSLSEASDGSLKTEIEHVSHFENSNTKDCQCIYSDLIVALREGDIIKETEAYCSSQTVNNSQPTLQEKEVNLENTRNVSEPNILQTSIKYGHCTMDLFSEFATVLDAEDEIKTILESSPVHTPINTTHVVNADDVKAILESSPVRTPINTTHVVDADDVKKAILENSPVHTAIDATHSIQDPMCCLPIENVKCLATCPVDCNLFVPHLDALNMTDHCALPPGKDVEEKIRASVEKNEKVMLKNIQTVQFKTAFCQICATKPDGIQDSKAAVSAVECIGEEEEPLHDQDNPGAALVSSFDCATKSTECNCQGIIQNGMFDVTVASLPDAGIIADESFLGQKISHSENLVCCKETVFDDLVASLFMTEDSAVADMKLDSFEQSASGLSSKIFPSENVQEDSGGWDLKLETDSVQRTDDEALIKSGEALSRDVLYVLPALQEEKTVDQQENMDECGVKNKTERENAVLNETSSEEADIPMITESDIESVQGEKVYYFFQDERVENSLKCQVEKHMGKEEGELLAGCIENSADTCKIPTAFVEERLQFANNDVAEPNFKPQTDFVQNTERDHVARESEAKHVLDTAILYPDKSEEFFSSDTKVELLYSCNTEHENNHNVSLNKDFSLPSEQMLTEQPALQSDTNEIAPFICDNLPLGVALNDATNQLNIIQTVINTEGLVENIILNEVISQSLSLEELSHEGSESVCTKSDSSIAEKTTSTKPDTGLASLDLDSVLPGDCITEVSLLNGANVSLDLHEVSNKAVCSNIEMKGSNDTLGFPSPEGENSKQRTGDEVDIAKMSSLGEENGSCGETMIQRDKDNFYLDSESALLDQTQSLECPGYPESDDIQLPVTSPTTPGVSPVHRESGSDGDVFASSDPGDDNVFTKQETQGLVGDCTSEVSVSCSSTDESVTTGPPTSTPERRPEVWNWNAEDVQCSKEAGSKEEKHQCETEEEEKDRLTEVPPLRSSMLRSSIRSLSPFRRHSWGPGKNMGTDSEMNQRSSLRVLGDIRKASIHRRSMSWCPSDVQFLPVTDEISSRSYSLEGLTAEAEPAKDSSVLGGLQQRERDTGRVLMTENEERGSLISLTEEEQESELGENSSLDSQKSEQLPSFETQIPHRLTKSVSLYTINQSGLDSQGRIQQKRRISFSFSISPLNPITKTVFSIGSSSSDEEVSDCVKPPLSNSSSLTHSICEESFQPSSLRKDSDGKSGTKVSRTFSYLKSKMYSSKKNKEKDKEKIKEKDVKEKEKDKKVINGHLFSAATTCVPTLCYQCSKALTTKEIYFCSNCTVYIHKSCRDALPVCAKVKMKQQKQQFTVPDSSSMPEVTMRTRSTLPRERPRSAIFIPEEQQRISSCRRATAIMPFTTCNLSKSVSISNITARALEDMPLKRYLSQSTDSLNKTNKANMSTESLVDEGAEMDCHLMGEFEVEAKELEADSWSLTVDKKLLKQLKKDVIKRQDVIYELIQTEMHHVRTLKIMSDVYSKGLLKEALLDSRTVEKMFPMLEDLLEIHTQFFSCILERRREAQKQMKNEVKEGGFVIYRIGDILVNQFSEAKAERMKKIYGKFCGRHNEAVNYYKELNAKEKTFQTFIQKKMSSAIVRRLGIPECILLVTQRITKYPVILQRILQYTKENEEDHKDLTQALVLVKDIIAAVDSKVNEYEKKKRLLEIYNRTENKSIMRMKSGQMFAREDLRRKKLLHDGQLQLKSLTGRMKDVLALLFTDVFVFLQEKDQKYVFASLDQRSTVISLQKLIVREVANEEKGLFLITAGIQNPEMVEVHASSKEERNNWIQLITDAMQSTVKDEDEGLPSESEEEKRALESKAREMREQLHLKDQQIVTLLEEKVKLFREISVQDDGASRTAAKSMFRASTEDVQKGENVMKEALKEVETLQSLVNTSLSTTAGLQTSSSLEMESGIGPVSLPRRAETFGGFDSHQMNSSKNGEKEEIDDVSDLRRTESDSVLKKDGSGNLLFMCKRNHEHVLHSVTHLHELLTNLQAVVVQQDTYIEDQRQLSERPSSRSSTRPNSLIEQEKQRSLEKQRQELANLHRLQMASAEERKKKEREFDVKQQELKEREERISEREEAIRQENTRLERDKEELQNKKEEYQKDLERLRAAQQKLEKERDQFEAEKKEHSKLAEGLKSPSSASDDSIKFPSSSSLNQDYPECELSVSPKKDPLSRTDSRQKGKHLNPFSHKSQGSDSHNQIPNRLLQLGKSKEKKEKKKKKSKDSQQASISETPAEGEEIFC